MKNRTIKVNRNLNWYIHKSRYKDEELVKSYQRIVRDMKYCVFYQDSSYIRETYNSNLLITQNELEFRSIKYDEDE
jgi:hypothetical protein